MQAGRVGVTAPIRAILRFTVFASASDRNPPQADIVGGGLASLVAVASTVASRSRRRGLPDAVPSTVASRSRAEEAAQPTRVACARQGR